MKEEDLPQVENPDDDEQQRDVHRNRQQVGTPALDHAGHGDLNAHLSTHQEVEIHYLHEYLHGRV